MHGILERLGCAELDVDTDVIRQTPHKEVRFLLWRELRGVAHHRVEVLLEVLDGVMLGKLGQLREAVGANGRPEALVGELLEALP